MKPLISFCSQCKGRTHHLKLTLLNNLQAIARYSNLDYVLLDFDSNDGLLKWIKSDVFKPYFDADILKYFRVNNQPYYLQSAVKNLSHRLSTGINLINVDADNSLSNIYVDSVVDLFANNKHIVVRAQTHISDETDEEDQIYLGAYGRIGMSRDLYDVIHGYDEIFKHWGGEDADLLFRLKNLSKVRDLNIIEIPRHKLGNVIIHNNAERIKYCPTIVLKDEIPVENINTTFGLDTLKLFNDSYDSTKFIAESYTINLIESRQYGQTFDVKQLVQGKLIEIGNI